jgi:hypothetical protein
VQHGQPVGSARARAQRGGATQPATVCSWWSWSWPDGHPEKRKVGGSMPPLTNNFVVLTWADESWAFSVLVPLGDLHDPSVTLAHRIMWHADRTPQEGS